MRTVIVCGGRDFHDEAWVISSLEAQHKLEPITLLVTGGARGADNLAACWAQARGIQTTSIPAKWKEHGRKAALIRNAEMLRRYPGADVLTLPGGTGTTDMIRKATDAGRKVILEG